jgi:hypothetical protein
MKPFAVIVIGLSLSFGVALAGCTPAEDQVVPRHPYRQLVVVNGKAEQAEPAQDAMLSRGKYRGGREQTSLSRSSATAVRPVAVLHVRPITQPPQPPRR